MITLGVVFPSRAVLLESLPGLRKVFVGSYRQDLSSIHQVDQVIYLLTVPTIEQAWRYGGIDFKSLYWLPNKEAFPSDVQKYLTSRIRKPFIEWEYA